ncbi:MAG TPA: hypothetical protein VL225_09815 [Vicinamibacterales bacterium]|jgi:hypothetical protein|nr:hypothetical protein [Vicinamibacterales bacterium]
MKRALAPLLFVLLAAGARPAAAAAIPVIDASAFGVELCAQSMCGSAIFVGVIEGRVGANPAALGTFAVSVNHDPLPAPFEESAITGGVFDIRVGLRTIRGVVTGGTLVNLGNNTFHVTMTLTANGGGVLTFDGILNHNVFPPTIAGRITSGL